MALWAQRLSRVVATQCRMQSGVLVRRTHPIAHGMPRYIVCSKRSLVTGRPITTAALPDNTLDGIAFGDLLQFLQDQYGLAQQAVEGTLSELAQILGYESVEEGTIIQYSDTKILMEEVGTYPATRKEFNTFLAQKANGVVTPTEDDVQEFYQLQKTLDVMEMAEARGATIDFADKKSGLMQLTMINGSVLFFKRNKGKVMWSSMS